MRAYKLVDGVMDPIMASIKQWMGIPGGVRSMMFHREPNVCC